jgi:hypothetical protein
MERPLQNHFAAMAVDFVEAARLLGGHLFNVEMEARRKRVRALLEARRKKSPSFT